MADPKKGTGKKPKGSGRRYTLMKIQETLLALSLQHRRMPGRRYLKLSELANLLHVRYKS